MNWRVIALLGLLILALVAIAMQVKRQTQPPTRKGGGPTAPAPMQPPSPVGVR